MAFPGSRIKPSKAKKLRKKKFRPLAPGIKNQLQLRKAIQRRTEAAIRPKLRAVNELGKEEGRAHSGRKRDLREMYGYQQQEVSRAYEEALQAANNLLGQTGSTVTGGQETLLAALESTRAGDRAQANIVGGVLPQGEADDAVVAASGVGSATLGHLAGDIADTSRAGAGRVANVSLGRNRALSKEAERYGAVQSKLREQRQDIREEIPSAREEARKAILDEELARAAERERERIARESLELEGRKTTTEEKAQKETERSNRAQESIAWGQIRAEKQRYRREVEDATSGAEQEAAEARAERYNRGVEVFQRYFENNKKRKAWNPGALYRSLLLVVPKKIALDIMKQGPGPFRRFVRKKRNPVGAAAEEVDTNPFT